MSRRRRPVLRRLGLWCEELLYDGACLAAFLVCCVFLLPVLVALVILPGGKPRR